MKNTFDLRKFLAENKVTKVEDVTLEVEQKLQEELDLNTEETLDEGLKDVLLKAIDKMFGIDKFNHCMDAGWDSSEECRKIKDDMSYSKVKSGFERGAGSSVTETEESTTDINEYRGVEDDIRAIIRDKAADSGFDEQEEAMEVMEFIGQEYDIDFEFGAGPSRQAEEVELTKEQAFKKSIEDILNS